VSFTQAAKDFAQFAQTQLPMPVLAIGGEKSLGEMLGQQMKLVALDLTVVVLKGMGHYSRGAAQRDNGGAGKVSLTPRCK
jgi:hypothetical protein